MADSRLQAESTETPEGLEVLEGDPQPGPSPAFLGMQVLSNRAGIRVTLGEESVYLTRTQASLLHGVLTAYLFDETLGRFKGAYDGNRSVSHSDDGSGGADVRPVSEPEDG